MAGRKGRSGPRVKPGNLRLVDGSFREDRHGSRETARRQKSKNQLDRIGSCPTWVPAAGRSEWKRVTPLLRERGTISKLDRQALIAYCVAVANLRDATEQIERDGALLVGAMGGQIRHPMFAVQNQASKQIRDYCIELGMTPSARMRVHSPNDEKAGEGVDSFQRECEQANKA